MPSGYYPVRTMENIDVDLVDCPQPLLAIFHRLLVGPPLLEFLMHALHPGEGFEEFLRITHEFLPEREREILALGLSHQRMGLFIRYFGEKYFPLADTGFTDDSYDELVTVISIERYGVDWDDYHQMEDYQLGIQLQVVVLASPYYMGDGAVVSLMERIAGPVGANEVKRVPVPGWMPGELEPLKGTRFEGLWLCAEWLGGCSGNTFIDTTWEEDLYEIGWEREAVEGLAREWPEAQKRLDVTHKLAKWLEKDPGKRFPQMLRFVKKVCGLPEDLAGVKSEGLPLVETIGGLVPAGGSASTNTTTSYWEAGAHGELLDPELNEVDTRFPDMDADGNLLDDDGEDDDGDEG